MSVADIRALLVLAIAQVCFGAESGWRHGWGSASEMTFADYNSNKLLTDAQAKFAADKYTIISLEKCTGVAQPMKTEAAIYTTARQLKKIRPSMKVFFYLATDQQGIQCYAAGDEWKAHPEWWLKDDNGNYVGSSGNTVLDCTNKEARDWWTSIPLRGDGNGTFEGSPVSELIDGVLADSGGWSHFANMSIERLEAQADAKRVMMGDMQRIMTAANGGIVMANGISMYGGANEDPRDPDGHNVGVLSFTDGIMSEHVAVFESVNSQNASFNMDTVSRNLDAILKAATWNNGSKSVFVQTWPGLYTDTAFTPSKTGPARVYPPVSSGGEPTPQSNDQWRQALRSHFAFAQALFLSVAESNIYWFYGGYWYPSNTGVLACPEDLSSCPAPPEWYPDLEKPLGAPLGPRVSVSPYVWTREFEHATVHLDLYHPNTSGVTYKSDWMADMSDMMSDIVV